MSRYNRLKYVILTVVLLLASLSSCTPYENLSAADMSVHFIDVGQADSIFIQLPEEKTMLVDAGNNSDGKKIASYIKRLGVNKIDYLVGTHPHADHIGGMDTVINAFDIGEFYMPRAVTNTVTFEEVLDVAEKKGLTIKTAKAGKTIFETESTSCRILSPVKDKYASLNEYSAILMLSCGDVKFLLTGDAETENESEISEKIDADVLKVAHHGSDTSSSVKFLDRVNPEYAVISVGRNNKYSHPSEKILKRLTDRNVKVLRTDLDGTIIMQTDGKDISYTTEKGR